MSADPALLPGRRTLRRLDLAAALSVAVFVVLGVLAGIELTHIAALGQSLRDASNALDQAAQGFAAFAGLPFIGAGAGALATDIGQTAASTRAGADQASAAIRAVAVIVGLAIALIPLPVLLAYLPLRLRRAREVRALRRMLQGPPDPLLVAHLAHTAVVRLPYPRLREISANPWADLAAGNHLRLAAAELDRLGVAPPPGWAP